MPEEILSLGVDTSGIKKADDALGSFVEAGKQAARQADAVTASLAKTAGAGNGLNFKDVAAAVASLGPTAGKQIDALGQGLGTVKGAAAEATAAINALAAAELAAARAAETIGKENLKKTGSQANPIDETIRKLKFQAEGLGATATQQKLIELASRGATRAQLEEAKAVYATIDAFKAKEIAALQAEKVANTATASSVARAAAIGGAVGSFVGAAALSAGRHIVSLVGHFEDLTQVAARYKDIEEKFGGSAESFAALDVAAKVAGVSIDQVGAASARMTKALVGVDDEGKAAGAALKAIGINVADFKRLSPPEQYETLGKALAGFADGTQKTAVATALLGRGGAELLPFVKELNQQGGRQVILTQDQIEKADDYKDAQARAKGTLQQYLALIASQALPGITALTGVFADLAKETLGVDTETGKLKVNNAVRDFAEAAAVSLGSFIDNLRITGAALSVFSTTVGSAFARAKLAAEFFVAGPSAAIAYLRGQSGALADSAKAIETATAKNAAAIGNFFDMDKNKVENAIRTKIKQNRELEAVNAKRRETEKGRPKIDFDGAVKPEKGAKGQLTDKDLLGFDVQAIKNALADLKAAYQDQETVLETVHSAGLASDKDYYVTRLDLMRQSNNAEISELENEVSLFKAFNDQRLGTDKDRLDNSRKISETEARIGRLRSSEGAKEAVLEIQRVAGLQRVATAYKEAQISGELYLDTIRRQHAEELEAFGKGNVEQRRVSGRNQVVDRYQTQRADLDKNKQLLEFEGKFTEEARTQYDERLALINKFQDKALAEWDDYYSQLRDKEMDGTNGMTRALQNYVDAAADKSKQVEDLFTKAFGGIEDALVTFATTGKLSFKGLVDSIVADISRMIIKEQLSKIISGANEGAASGGGGWGSLLGAALGAFGFGGGYSANGGTGYSNAAGISGGRATGGPVMAGSTTPVNERGMPEVLTMGNKQYLMPLPQGAQVTPPASARPINQTLNFMVQGEMTKASQKQAAAAAGVAVRRAVSSLR